MEDLLPFEAPPDGADAIPEALRVPSVAPPLPAPLRLFEAALMWPRMLSWGGGLLLWFAAGYSGVPALREQQWNLVIVYLLGIGLVRIFRFNVYSQLLRRNDVARLGFLNPTREAMRAGKSSPFALLAATSLLAEGRLREAEELLELVGQDQENPHLDETLHGMVQAYLLRRRGHLEDAADRIRRLEDSPANDSRPTVYQHLMTAFRARLDGDRGEYAEARERLAGIDRSGLTSDLLGALASTEVWLDLHEGDAAGARNRARQAWGEDPVDRSTRILVALCRAADGDRAPELRAPLLDGLALARTWASSEREKLGEVLTAYLADAGSPEEREALAGLDLSAVPAPGSVPPPDPEACAKAPESGGKEGNFDPRQLRVGHPIYLLGSKVFLLAGLVLASVMVSTGQHQDWLIDVVLGGYILWTLQLGFSVPKRMHNPWKVAFLGGGGRFVYGLFGLLILSNSLEVLGKAGTDPMLSAVTGWCAVMSASLVGLALWGAPPTRLLEDPDPDGDYAPPRTSWWSLKGVLKLGGYAFAAFGLLMVGFLQVGGPGWMMRYFGGVHGEAMAAFQRQDAPAIERLVRQTLAKAVHPEEAKPAERFNEASGALTMLAMMEEGKPTASVLLFEILDAQDRVLGPGSPAQLQTLLMFRHLLAGMEIPRSRFEPYHQRVIERSGRDGWDPNERIQATLHYAQLLSTDADRARALPLYRELLEDAKDRDWLRDSMMPAAAWAFSGGEEWREFEPHLLDWAKDATRFSEQAGRRYLELQRFQNVAGFYQRVGQHRRALEWLGRAEKALTKTEVPDHFQNCHFAGHRIGILEELGDPSVDGVRKAHDRTCQVKEYGGHSGTRQPLLQAPM